MLNDEAYRLKAFERLRNMLNDDGSVSTDVNVAFAVIKNSAIPESLYYDWLKYMGINSYEFMRGYNQLESQGKLENPDAVAKFLFPFIKKLEDENDNFFDDTADIDDWEKAFFENEFSDSKKDNDGIIMSFDEWCRKNDNAQVKNNGNNANSDDDWDFLN